MFSPKTLLAFAIATFFAAIICILLTSFVVPQTKINGLVTIGLMLCSALSTVRYLKTQGVHLSREFVGC